VVGDKSRNKEMKTGILGGTFDPVHNAHMIIAGVALNQLELDEVLFIPTSHTPLKEDTVITPIEHRVKMLELALAANPFFRLSMIEIERAGISYTVDTIAGLKESRGDDSELYFITGLDSLGTLTRWKEPDSIIKMCRLVTVRRPGYEVPDMEKLEKDIPGIAENGHQRNRYPEKDCSRSAGQRSCSDTGGTVYTRKRSLQE